MYYTLLPQREGISIYTLVGDTGQFACNPVTWRRNRALSTQLKLAHLSPQPTVFLLIITRKTQILQKHKWELKFIGKNTISNYTPPNKIDSTKLNKLKDFTSTYSNIVDRTNLKDNRILWELRKKWNPYLITYQIYELFDQIEDIWRSWLTCNPTWYNQGAEWLFGIFFFKWS